MTGVAGIPPAVTAESSAFWDAAREGRLVVERCCACGTHAFPPYGVCRACRHRETHDVEVAGPGIVYSFTVNHQRWLSDQEVPFALVWVEFPDHDGVRVVGRLRGCEPEHVRIGMAVDVGFEPGPDGFAVPSFVARADDDDHPVLVGDSGPETPVLPTRTVAEPVLVDDLGRRTPERPTRTGGVRERFEERAVLAGVGQSAIGRQVDRSAFQLTVDAVLAAVADAGLAVDDIDGIATFPGGGKANVPGYAGPGIYEVQDALGIETRWRSGLNEGFCLPFHAAAQAVASGAARHVVVYRTVKEGSAARSAGGRPAYGSTRPEAEGPMQWLLPLGALSPVCHVAPYATRYLSEFGATREQLGWIPVTQRAHAARNPDAVYRDPLRIDDYLGARLISSPVCLFDCDVPIDGATAVVVSAADTAADLRAPVAIEAMAGVTDDRPSWEQWRDMTRVGHATAAALWDRTDLRPGDVDVAQLYDGFTIEVIWWLEALGFCGVGEGADFVDGGKRIALDGDLPLNTWGGQLSGGRLHAAFGHTAEAVRQLRGEAGERQVDGAEVTVVTNAGGFESGAAVLTAWRG